MLVGPTEVPFVIHTQVLRRIKFLRGCLDSGMAETREGVVRLPEYSVAAFTQLAHWLHFGLLQFNLAEEAAIVCEDDGPIPAWFSCHFETIMDLHILADKLCAEEVQDYTIDMLQRTLIHINPAPPRYGKIINNCSKDSGLYRLFSQHLALRKRRMGRESFKTLHGFYEEICEIDGGARFVLEAFEDHPKPKPIFPCPDKCRYHTYIDTPKCAIKTTKSK